MSERLTEVLQDARYNRARAVSYVALDVASWDEAQGLVDAFGEAVTGYKVGLELFHREGPDVVKRLAASGKRIFLDVKLHDIPNTVAGALHAIRALPVELVNVHATGGRAMLEAARDVMAASPYGTKLIAVTVLTSLSNGDLEDIGYPLPVADLVHRLVDLSVACGIDGVVASAEEIVQIRAQAGPAFAIVVPGTRPTWASADDQKRSATPVEALRRGATHLVVGRAVTASADRLDSLKRYWDEIVEGEE